MSNEKPVKKIPFGDGIDRIQDSYLEAGKLAHYTGKEKSGMINENKDAIAGKGARAQTEKEYNKRDAK